MNTIISIVGCYILLLASVVWHEFGHYVFAKTYKFDVVEFSLFVGKQIYKKGIFTIRNKPIGAYVAYAYETEDKDKDYLKKRLWITIAGLMFNFILVEIGLIIGGNIGLDLIIINLGMITLNIIPMGVFNGNKTDAGNAIKLYKEIKTV